MNFSLCLFTPDSSLLPSLCLSFPSHLLICLSEICLTTRLHIIMLFQSVSACRLPRKAAPSFQLYVPPSGLAFVQAPACLSACLPVCLPACLRLSLRLSIACLTVVFFLPRSECSSFECEPLLLPRGPRSTERLTWL